ENCWTNCVASAISRLPHDGRKLWRLRQRPARDVDVDIVRGGGERRYARLEKQASRLFLRRYGERNRRALRDAHAAGIDVVGRGLHGRQLRGGERDERQ